MKGPMQQAYQALRIVSEAQTIRIVLATQPDELSLRELGTVCASFSAGGGDGIKAVVLDFMAAETRPEQDAQGYAHVVEGKDAMNRVPTGVERAYEAVL